MGTIVYVSNSSLEPLTLKLVKQGPTHAYDDALTAGRNTVAAGASRVKALSISRGFTLQPGNAIDTAELQVSIGKVFIGAVVVLIDSRGQPLKSELFWALRGANEDLTKFSNGTELSKLSYRTTEYDVTLSIAGESHGLGFYDIVVNVTAVPLSITHKITFDITLQAVVGPRATHSLSIDRGAFYVLSADDRLSERRNQTSFLDGKPIRLWVSSQPGAILQVQLSGGKPFPVPLDEFKATPLTITLHAANLQSGAATTGDAVIPISIVSPPLPDNATVPATHTQQVSVDGGLKQDLDTGNPAVLKWALDSFGDPALFIAENAGFVWHGFRLLDPGLVKANVLRYPGRGDIRVVFSGYRHGNPIYSKGFWAAAKQTRFVALLNGGGTFDGALAALKAGLVPSGPSLVLLALSNGPELVDAYNEGSYVSIPWILGTNYLKGQAASVVSVTISSAIVSTLTNIRGAPNPTRVPVVLLIAIQAGTIYVGVFMVSLFV
jgi:hypothetical protein